VIVVICGLFLGFGAVSHLETTVGRSILHVDYTLLFSNLISTSHLAGVTTLLLRTSLRAAERKSALGLEFFSVLHGLPPVKTTQKPALLA
jgi:hypothetical protein